MRPGPLRIGVTLPTFRDDAAAVEVARQAEDAGLDGVFVFDHLWPMGRPDRPALAAFPVLGAVAASTAAIAVGPLVARVGLVPDEVLAGRFRALHALAWGRVIAGLGTGDAKSAAENIAFGVPVAPAADRRRSLGTLSTALAGEGMAVWVGGGSASTVAVAAAAGASVNLWEADAAAIARQAEVGDVTWGGPVPGDAEGIVRHLSPLADAGASWLVCGWPQSLRAVADAARRLRAR